MFCSTITVLKASYNPQITLKLFMNYLFPFLTCIKIENKDIQYGCCDLYLSQQQNHKIRHPLEDKESQYENSGPNTE